MRRFFFGTRRRKTATAITVVALAGAGAAIAAFIVYTGATGTGSAHVQNSTVQNALTLTEIGTPELAPNTSTPTTFRVQNADTQNGHHLDTLTGTVTTSPDASCANFIGWSSDSALLITYAPAADIQVTGGSYNVLGNIPASCAGANVTLTLAGTTTP